MSRNTNRRSRSPKSDKQVKYDAKSRDKDFKKQNDPDWYTGNSQLALDSGRFSFSWPVGAPVDFSIPSTGATPTILGAPSNAVHFPGVFAMDFIPAYGNATVAEDPINVASYAVFAQVRKGNSGYSNYDHTDLMLYLMAMDNIYMLYQHMVRAYGLLTVFAQRNRNYPRILFNALRLNYDDLSQHIADLRYYINAAALRIGAMNVPATMPLFLRHMWMCSGVYADAPSIKSQVYVFKPGWVGLYNEKTSSQGGFLEGDSRLTTRLCTFNDLVTLMDLMIGRVIQSQDCAIMSGDIEKAYGPEKMFKLAQVAEDYRVEPVFNPAVLRQIQNATLIDTVSLATVGTTPVLMEQDINQNILKTGLTVSDKCYCIMGKRLLTGSSEAPSPEEVLENTRLMVTSPTYTFTGTDLSSAKVTFDKPNYGTEIISNARLFDYDNPSGDRVYYGRTYTNGNWQTSNSAADARLEFFNYHPLIGTEYQPWQNQTLSSVAWNFRFDVDDYTLIDNHDLEKLHNTALLSLFNVPELGHAK